MGLDPLHATVDQGGSPPLHTVEAERGQSVSHLRVCFASLGSSAPAPKQTVASSI